MTRLLARMYGWLLLLIRQGQPAQPVEPIPVPAPIPPKARSTPKPDNDDEEGEKVPPEHATFGAWTHFSDVLNQLGRYFEALKVLRKSDPETYRLYGRVGGLVLSSKHWFEFGGLNPYWRLEKRPSFGLVHFASQETKDSIPVRLAYLTKYKHRSFVQPVHDEIYEVNLVYVTKAHPTPAHAMYHVAVDATGRPYLLREHLARPVRLPRKIKRRHRAEAVIMRHEWQVPRFLIDIYKDRKGQTKIAAGTVEEFAVEVFAMVANAIQNAKSGGIQVRVKKDKLAAMFTVDMVSTPRFFAKRDKSYNEAGNAHRIFHVVRPHKRTLAGGSVKYLKMHFRGERQFSWLGYDVQITVPGKHHTDLMDFDAASLDVDVDNLPRADVLDSRQLGRRLSDHMEGKH